MSGYKFLGFFDDRTPEEYRVEPSLVKGTLSDVEKFSLENHIDEIICALPAGDDRKAVPIMKFAENNMIRFLIVPDFMRFVNRSVNLGFLEQSIPVVSLREEPLQKSYNRLLKRCFDLVVSLIFTLTVFPFLYIILGTIIKCTSKGPIFFKQKRTGENGREFNCLKFRTMKVNKDADKVQATKGDSRITKIGAFMRKTNLDEMPQFLNVLIGDMSIVGPRPHMLKHTEMYSKLIDKYMVRHYAKPGITGWAQVTGYRGETKELSEMEGRIKQDVWYIENWTFWLDIRIIFKTVANMIKGEEKAY
jgi:putative colanic acid biosynthesis UDP-glucose lipid carrier transferase